MGERACHTIERTESASPDLYKRLGVAHAWNFSIEGWRQVDGSWEVSCQLA